MADWFEGFSLQGFLGISAIAVNSGLPLQINGGQGCLVLDIPKICCFSTSTSKNKRNCKHGMRTFQFYFIFIPLQDLLVTLFNRRIKGKEH